MAGPGDGDGKLPPVDHDPLNEGAVGKIIRTNDLVDIKCHQTFLGAKAPLHLIREIN